MMVVGWIDSVDGFEVMCADNPVALLHFVESVDRWEFIVWE